MCKFIFKKTIGMWIANRMAKTFVAAFGVVYNPKYTSDYVWRKF